ncbi:MAG TPA: ATP-binding protein [Enhygromyxa sp.]|nr:ATP-binding protein [Enhygromyxa sp.]
MHFGSKLFRRSNLGVRAKFLIVTISIVATVDFAAGIYLQWKLRAAQERRIEDELSRQARAARDLLDLGLGSDALAWTPERIDPIADRLGASFDSRVTIIGADGSVLGDSQVATAELPEIDDHSQRPEVLAAAVDSCGLSRRYSTTVATDMLYCAIRFSVGEQQGFIRVSTPLSEVDRSVAQLRVILAFAGLLSLSLAVGAGALAARAMYAKVRELMEAARAVAEGDKERRLPIVSSDEFGGIAGSLNRVSDQLAHTVKELAAERDLFEAVIQSMDEAVLAVDAERRIIAVNRSARELLGIDMQLRGRLLLDAVAIPQLSEALDHALRGESRSIDVKLQSNGSLRHLMVRATPQGESGGAVLVMHDVTEIRRLETVRRDFVANVSHELRTPVSVIQANTETLLSGALDEPAQARRFLEAVRRNAERLGQLIADLLDISRIEAGKYKIEMRPLSMTSLARSVSKAVAEACRTRGVIFEVQTPADLEVRADAGALEQVLVNLVENAVKYGPEGGHVELVAIEQGAMVRIEVRDEGPGIAPDHRSRVFERFYRVDPGRSRHMGGTGLGLAIVKNLTEAMGGDVGVDPREPNGSVFWVRLGKAGGGQS